MSKQILSEEFKRMQLLAGLINENQLNEAEDLLSMIQDYVSAHYTSDQGYGEGVVEKAEADMEKIKTEVTKMKGAEYFKNLETFAGLVTYDDEYAGREESDEIQPQLEELAQKLGFTIDQLR
jgi:hypothetical protein